MKKVLITIWGVLLFCRLFAQDIPLKISYQGKLLEKGKPVNGTKRITFTIGSWSETQNVPISDGIYSVTLGKDKPIPIDIFDNTSTINLQIKIEQSDLTPQTEILAVPYSYKAEKAVDTKKIAGNSVLSTLPELNQVLKWNGT